MIILSLSSSLSSLSYHLWFQCWPNISPTSSTHLSRQLVYIRPATRQKTARIDRWRGETKRNSVNHSYKRSIPRTCPGFLDFHVKHNKLMIEPKHSLLYNDCSSILHGLSLSCSRLWCFMQLWDLAEFLHNLSHIHTYIHILFSSLSYFGGQWTTQEEFRLCGLKCSCETWCLRKGRETGDYHPGCQT